MTRQKIENSNHFVDAKGLSTDCQDWHRVSICFLRFLSRWPTNVDKPSPASLRPLLQPRTLSTMYPLLPPSLFPPSPLFPSRFSLSLRASPLLLFSFYSLRRFRSLPPLLLLLRFWFYEREREKGRGLWGWATPGVAPSLFSSHFSSLRFSSLLLVWRGCHGRCDARSGQLQVRVRVRGGGLHRERVVRGGVPRAGTAGPAALRHQKVQALHRQS